MQSKIGFSFAPRTCLQYFQYSPHFKFIWKKRCRISLPIKLAPNSSSLPLDNWIYDTARLCSTSALLPETHYFCHVIVAFSGMGTQCRKPNVASDCQNDLSGVHMNSFPTLPELQNKRNLSCIFLVNKPFHTKKVSLLIQEKCKGFYWENIP